MSHCVTVIQRAASACRRRDSLFNSPVRGFAACRQGVQAPRFPLHRATHHRRPAAGPSIVVRPLLGLVRCTLYAANDARSRTCWNRSRGRVFLVGRQARMPCHSRPTHSITSSAAWRPRYPNWRPARSRLRQDNGSSAPLRWSNAPADWRTRSRLRVATDNLDGPLRARNAQTIIAIVQRTLAKAELEAPPQSQGSFIVASNSFDAFAAVRKVLGTARADVLLVDANADAKVLTDFAVLAPGDVVVRLLGRPVGSQAVARSRGTALGAAVRGCSTPVRAPRRRRDPPGHTDPGGRRHRLGIGAVVQQAGPARLSGTGSHAPGRGGPHDRDLRGEMGGGGTVVGRLARSAIPFKFRAATSPKVRPVAIRPPSLSPL